MPNKGQQVSEGGQSNKSRKGTARTIKSTKTGNKAQSKFKPPRAGRATSSGTAAKGRKPQVSTLGAEKPPRARQPKSAKGSLRSKSSQQFLGTES
jgi:hypothetical protein